MDFKGNKKVGGKRTINKKFGPSGKRTKKKKKTQDFLLIISIGSRSSTAHKAAIDPT